MRPSAPLADIQLAVRQVPFQQQQLVNFRD